MRSEIASLDGTCFDVLIRAGGLAAAVLAQRLSDHGMRVLVAAPGDPATDPWAISSLLCGGMRLPVLAAQAPLPSDPGLDDGVVGGRGAPTLDELAADGRELLLRAAPHLVRPVPVVATGFAPGTVGDALDVLATRWRRTVHSTLPPPEIVDTPRGPGLSTFEARIDAPRLVVASLRAAVARGAVVVGGCDEARTASRPGAVVLRDRGTGDSASLRAERRIAAARYPRAALRVRDLVDPGVADDTVTMHRVAGSSGVRVYMRMHRPGVGYSLERHAIVAPAAEHVTPRPGDTGVCLPGDVVASALLARTVRLAARLTGRPPARSWRDGFEYLPGGEGPHDIGDPLWWRLGGEAVVVRGALGERPAAADLLREEVRFAVRELGARSLDECVARLRPAGPEPLAGDREVRLRAVREAWRALDGTPNRLSTGSG